MNYTVKSFFQAIRYKKLGFIGVGVSHTELIKMFALRGFDVTLRDKRSKDELGELANELESMGVRLILGENYLESFDEDIIFRTPGMYYNNPKLVRARKNGRVITSELELFLKLCPCKTYGITGSDGKTTTTTLISRLLEMEGKRVFLGGNIGAPLLTRIEEIKEDDVAVIELSSFQLLSMREKLDVAVVTNITPNHLDVHGTMREYTLSKMNIFTHQDAFSRTVLNMNCDKTNELLDYVRGELFLFGDKLPSPKGCYCGDHGNIYGVINGEKKFIMNAKDIKIPGYHNVQNFMAAICATWGEVKLETIKELAMSFGGVPHRIEFVRSLGGVSYYNDSISTSPTRLKACLSAFEDNNNVLIAGGYDKKLPFEPVADDICQKVKTLILIGDTADKIQRAVKASQLYDEERLSIIRAESMKEAVSLARANAVRGGRVLLSPACASFDMYKNFELRGEDFKAIVGSLE